MRRFDFDVTDSPWDAQYFNVLPRGVAMDFGGAAGEAGHERSQAAWDAMGIISNYNEEAKQFVRPWRRAGNRALELIGGMLGLPGYKQIDPTKQLESTPGYQFALGQGVDALDRGAAARGNVLSGAHRVGLMDFGQGLALNKAWTPYMNALGMLEGQGLQAGTQMGNWNMQAGGQMAQGRMAAGQAEAEAAIQQANAENSLWGGLIKGGLGLLTGPLGSALGSGLTNMFSGASGGAAAPATDLLPNYGRMYNPGFSGDTSAFAPVSGSSWRLM